MPPQKMNPEAADNTSARQAESTGFVYIAAAIAALGGLLFGYDTGVISGALIFIQKSFALSTFHQELVVSVVLVGAAVGSLGGGNLADHIGRKTNLLITSVIFILGAIICAAAGSEVTLIVGRTIVGLGIGLASSTVPLYISEVSPAKARGWQVSLFQLAITIGILAAYLVDYAFAQSEQWRWMLGLAVVPGAILGLGMLYMPETPRWLAKNGQVEKAIGVLRRIRGTQNVEAEFKEIQATLSETNERGQWSDLLKASIRPALIVGIGLAIFQQVTGINTVIYYAPADHSFRGHLFGLRRNSGHRRHRLGERHHDTGFHVAHRPRRKAPVVADRNRWHGTFSRRSRFHLPRISYRARRGLRPARRCNPHGLCRLLRDKPRPDFLADHRRNLSTESKGPGGRNRRFLELGRQLRSLANVSYARPNVWSHDDILAIRDTRSRCLDLLLLSCPGNEGPHVGRNRGFLAQPPNAQIEVDSRAGGLMKNNKIFAWSAAILGTAFFALLAAHPAHTQSAISELNVTIREWDVPTPKARPHDPALGPDGALWFTEQEANKLGRLDPADRQNHRISVENSALRAARSGGRRGRKYLVHRKLCRPNWEARSTHRKHHRISHAGSCGPRPTYARLRCARNSLVHRAAGKHGWQA